MSSSRKKVIVRRLAGDTAPGYLPQSNFVRLHAIELLDLAGRVASIALEEIKYICFVRDFNLNEATDPERLSRRSFLARPRIEGLWLRVTFKTGDQLEGLASIDLTLLDGVIEDEGLHLIIPDARSNTQRLYVPRIAVVKVELLAVIKNPSKPRTVAPSKRKTDQEELFPMDDPPGRAAS